MSMIIWSDNAVLKKWNWTCHDVVSAKTLGLFVHAG
jgi:hypothetical protein